jgi:hypothetical protein
MVTWQRWTREVPVPEFDTSVFIIPRTYVKNGLDRYVALSRIAKSGIHEQRGEHAEFVFTCEGWSSLASRHHALLSAGDWLVDSGFGESLCIAGAQNSPADHCASAGGTASV